MQSTRKAEAARAALRRIQRRDSAEQPTAKMIAAREALERMRRRDSAMEEIEMKDAGIRRVRQIRSETEDGLTDSHCELCGEWLSVD